MFMCVILESIASSREGVSAPSVGLLREKERQRGDICSHPIKSALASQFLKVLPCDSLINQAPYLNLAGSKSNKLRLSEKNTPSRHPHMLAKRHIYTCSRSPSVRESYSAPSSMWKRYLMKFLRLLGQTAQSLHLCYKWFIPHLSGLFLFMLLQWHQRTSWFCVHVIGFRRVLEGHVFALTGFLSFEFELEAQWLQGSQAPCYLSQSPMEPACCPAPLHPSFHPTTHEIFSSSDYLQLLEIFFLPFLQPFS